MRVPEEVVDAPPSETSKVRLDGVLNNLMWLKISLLIAGRLGWMTFKAASQPELFGASETLQSVSGLWLCGSSSSDVHLHSVSSLSC